MQLKFFHGFFTSLFIFKIELDLEHHWQFIIIHPLFKQLIHSLLHQPSILPFRPLPARRIKTCHHPQSIVHCGGQKLSSVLLHFQGSNIEWEVPRLPPRCHSCRQEVHQVSQLLPGNLCHLSKHPQVVSGNLSIRFDSWLEKDGRQMMQTLYLIWMNDFM